MASRPATPGDRLRMLWHVGAARCWMGDRSFGVCVERGWALPRCREAGKVDYCLTERGRAVAQHQATLGWPMVSP